MFILRLPRVSLVFALILTPNFADAQSIDSSNRKIDEAVLVRNQQQSAIDSLVKIKLAQELKEAVGDQKKTLELEKKLRAIEQQDSVSKAAQKQEIEALKKTTAGYPVKLNLDTLFYIYTRTGSFDAQHRAAAISEKITAIYNDAFYNPDSLRVKAIGDGTDIVYKKNLIVSTISTLDGLWFDKTSFDLANEHLATIKSTIKKEREAHSLRNWLKKAGLVLLIILMLWGIIKVINYIFRKTARYIVYKKTAFEKGINIKNTQVITAKYLEATFLKINAVLKVLVIILAIYLSLPLLFSIFPETESWTNTLLKWILSPLRVAVSAVVDYLPNFFTIVVIYFIFKYLLKAVRFLFIEIRVGNVRFRGFHRDWAMPTFNILKVILYAFVLILIFPYLPGSSSPAFQGVSVFLGILLSLGSSSATSNMVAGLVITYMRPFKVGDRVKIGDVVGDVVEKTMLVTRIKTIKNEDVTVPNSMVLSSSTVNYSSRTRENEPGLILNYTVTVGYDVSWKLVYELLIKSALKTVHIEAEPQPFVLQTNLNDFYISYQINAYTREANLQAVIYSNLLEHIQDVFKEANVEILSPQYNVIRTED